MHDHPAGFTWGNTAASMVAVLPEAGKPFMWWAAATPCTSVYLPISAETPELPAVLATAGTQHTAGPNPEGAAADTYTTDSYWWAFQRLLETVAGDDLGSAYLARQPIVRKRLDLLQQRWSDEVDVIATDASAQDWLELTTRCTDEALQVTRELVADFNGNA
jgi:secernin